MGPRDAGGRCFLEASESSGAGFRVLLGYKYISLFRLSNSYHIYRLKGQIHVVCPNHFLERSVITTHSKEIFLLPTGSF